MTDALLWYEAVCRYEAELDDLKSAMPEWLKEDRNRLMMSLRCARVSIEVRLFPKFPKRGGARATGTAPRDPAPRLPL